MLCLFLFEYDITKSWKFFRIMNFNNSCFRGYVIGKIKMNAKKIDVAISEKNR